MLDPEKLSGSLQRRLCMTPKQIARELARRRTAGEGLRAIARSWGCDHKALYRYGLHGSRDQG